MTALEVESPTVAEVALELYDAGLAVVPPRQDGTKAPMAKWKQYQATPPSRAQVESWYSDPNRTGVGIVCGAVSGGLELFEFEGRAVDAGLFARFTSDAQDDPHLDEVWSRVIGGWSETSPSGGIHVYYRCDTTGNVTLAHDQGGKVLIETKGEGGYVIVAPSGGNVHPTGKEWERWGGGAATVATITSAERTLLLDHARRYTERLKPEPAPAPATDTLDIPTGTNGSGWVSAVIDDYNRRTSWFEVLAGTFEHVRDRGTVSDWHYIGAASEVSATVNAKGTDRLVVFSGTAAGHGWNISTGDGLAPSYDRFSAHAQITRGRNDTTTRTDMARELQNAGYGPPAPVSPHTAEVAEVAEPFELLKRVDLSNVDTDQESEVVGGFLFAGRWTALVAPAKQGKSTVLLTVAVSLTKGVEPFTGQPTDPLNVLYLDAEMGRLDVAERIRDEHALSLKPLDPALERFHYSDLVPILATPQGSAATLGYVDHHDISVVIIDGINGVVQGAEKDDATWIPLYRDVIAHLKARGVAVLTADNLGKDKTLGPRGSSVKLDKPDGVVEMARTDAGAKLKATHRRTTAYAEVINLTVTGLDGGNGPLAFRHDIRSWPAGTKAKAVELDRIGAPANVSRRTAKKMLEEHGLTAGKNETLAAAIRFRQTTGYGGDHLGDHLK